MSDYRLTVSGSLDIPKTIAEINAQLQKVQNSLSKLSITDTKGIKQYTAEINNAGKLASALANSELNDAKRVGAAKNQSIQQEITARRQALNLAKLATNEAKFAAQQQKAWAQSIAAETKKAFASDKLSTQISTAQIKIQAFAKQYSAIMTDPALKDAWGKLVDESKLITSKEQLELFNAKMGEFNQKVIAAGKATRSFGDELKNNIVKMGSWMLLGGLIATVARQFKEVYTNVVAVNTAMVSLRKVTNETDATYSAFLDRTAQKAVELSASIAGLIEATANFARLGYSLNDAEMLGQVAVMYKNVGDGVESVDVASSTVLSAMKGFNIEASDSISIVDKLNEVGNNFAISSSGIGDALQRSSAAMANAGNTIDQTIGLIVAANNVIQDPDVVGTMWKTVAMRIRGAKTELEEAGLDTEAMAVSTSTLRDKIMAITNIDGGGGFDILTDTGAFKSTYDIILGISQVWEELGTKNPIGQAALLELLAGKRQGNALAAALTNMEDGVAATETAMNSAGSAAKEYEAWQKGIEAHLQSLGASWEAFSIKTLNSDAIITVVDAIKLLSTALTGLVNTFGTLPTIAGIFGGVQGASGKGLFKSALDSSGAFKVTFGQSQLKTDINALTQYNQAIASGVESQLALQQVQRGGSQFAVDYAKSLNGATANTEAYAVANKSLGKAFNLAEIGAKALNMAVNAAIMMGITAIISLIIKGVDKLIVTTEEHREQLADLKSEYDSIVSSLADVNKQLDDTQARMSELETGGISLVEDEEYQKLLDTNTELERTQRLLKAQEIVSNQDIQKEFLASMESAYGGMIQTGGTPVAISESGLPTYIAGMTDFAAPDYSTGQEYLQQRIANLQTMGTAVADAQNALISATEAQDPSAMAKAQSAYDTIKSQFDSLSSEINKELDQIKTDSDNVQRVENPVTEAEKAINNWLDFAQSVGSSFTDAVLTAAGYDVTEPIEQTNVALEKSKDTVTSLTTAHEALSSALKQQADDGYLSKESYDALIATNSEYANAIEIVNGKMQINIDKAYEVSRASVDTEYNQLRAQQALAELNLEYELAHENSADRVEDLRDEIQQYDFLIEKLIDSRSEMQAFKDASITNNSGANYDYSVDNMVKTFADGAETLRTQTDEFQSAARYFTGQESTTAEQASQWLEKNGSWVDGTTDGLNNFIKASLEAGAVVQKNGQYMAADGMTAQKWADLVGTSAEFVTNELGKLNEYQGQNWQLQLEPPTKEEIYKATGAQEYLDAYDTVITAQKKMQSGDDSEVGRGTQQLLDTISKVDTDQLKETIDQMSILNTSSGGAYDVQLGKLQDLYDLLTNPEGATLGESIDVTVTDALGKEHIVNLNADAAISTIQSQILQVCAKPYSITIKANVTGLPNSGGIQKSKSGTGVGIDPSGAMGTASASGSSAANGRYKTRSGRTLMGELGQEMVVDMNTGSWYTVGDYGAEFRNLPENAIVFNHVQTQNILKNGRINNRGQAMVGGNAAPTYVVSGGGGLIKSASSKIATGYYRSSAAESNKEDLTSDTFENEIDMLEHQINILKDMINLYEEGSSQWFSQQSNIIDTYKAAAQVAQAEYDRLHAAGYNVASKEMRSLMEDVIKYKSEVFKASEDYWNAEKENATDTLKYYKSKTQAVVDLKKSYHDLVTEVQSEQISLDKEMQTAAQSYPFLSEGERAAVFDDADYKALSSELAGIVSNANAMYVQYLEQIKSVGEDSEYQLESITDEFERQYDLQIDAYNVAKARLAVFKAQKNLENVQGERSVAALIGGVWTWVADSDNVQSALEDLSNAEQDLADAQNDATFNADIANLESTISAIDEQISAIDNLTFTMDGLATEIHSLVDEIQAQVLNNVSGATLSYLANPQAYSSTLTDLFSTSAAQNMWSSVASGAMTGLMNSINTSGFVAQILSNLSGMGSTTQTSGDHYQLVWEGNVVAEGEQVKTFIAMLRALVPLYDVNL